jgi:hypothetical protein
MRNFHSLSYAIARGIAGPLLNVESTHQDLLGLCRGFIHDLANEVEDQLTVLFERIASAIQRTPESLGQTLNALVEATSGKQGSVDVTKVTLGAASHVLDMLAAYYRRRDRDQVAERAGQLAKAGGDVVPALSALISVQTKLESVVSPDVAKELRAFAETRNLVSHRLGPKTVDYEDIMQGTFFGLRMLDRMRQLRL